MVRNTHPVTKITGGKVMSGKTLRVANRAAQALGLAAAALRSSQSALGAFFRRLCSRVDKPKAVTAAAHKLARLIYPMLIKGEDMYNCCAGHSPAPGPFPPARPRKRARWFNELLAAAARKRATRTLGKHTPRMVKRRNSPYAPHKRLLPIRLDMDCTPQMLDPPPLHPRQRFPTGTSI